MATCKISTVMRALRWHCCVALWETKMFYRNGKAVPLSTPSTHTA